MPEEASVFIFILLVVAYLSLGVLVAAIPGRIASWRKHKNVRGVYILGFTGIIFPPFWLVAFCWAIMGATTQKEDRIVAEYKKLKKAEEADYNPYDPLSVAAKPSDTLSDDEISKLLSEGK